MTIDTDIEIIPGNGNVYADLGHPDAEGMAVKAKLVMVIADGIKAAGLTQSAAAARIGMTQPQLSTLLRGRFRGVSETKLMAAIAALGHPVTIVVGKRGEGATVGVRFDQAA